MDFSVFKKLVIARCEELGLKDYELYYQMAESVSAETYQHSISEFTSSTEGGVCFRCIVNGKMGYASTESLTEAQAKTIVARAVDNAMVLEAEEQVFLGEGGKTYAPLEERNLTMPTAENLIHMVLSTQEQLYAADPAVIDGCATQAIAERSCTAIYNSRGLDLSCENVLNALVVGALVSDGKEMADGYDIKLGALDQMDTEAMTQKAAKTALGKLGGDVAPTGQYPVVFNPEAMCDLLSTFSGIFSAENAQKGLSKLSGKEASVIASPIVTLVDDPFCPHSPINRTFDAEGSPTYRKNLIENGVLQTLLHNLKTANMAGIQTTGNASKAGYDSPVGIRPFTLYLTAGTMTEEELLHKAENGVYIQSLSGLHAGADPVSGDFSLQSAGFMVENGQKTTPVKSFTVAGNFYTLLQNVVALASNLEFPGMGRVGSPSVLVQGLSIAGK